MQKHTLLPVICCALVLTAVGADYGLGQMDVPKPHRLPVESFPAQIGDWRGGPVQTVDPDIQRALATAKIVERPYINSLGQQVDLMLLTATEDEDMHSPKACFPSQGWTLTNVHDIQMNGQPATQMTAQFEEGPRQTVLYWLTGYFPPAPPRNALLRKAAVWRTHVMGAHNNMSLFVRIIGPDTPLGNHALAEFTQTLHGPIQTLVGQSAQPAKKILLPRQF
jgi:EpsI family protein